MNKLVAELWIHFFIPHARGKKKTITLQPFKGGGENRARHVESTHLDMWRGCSSACWEDAALRVERRNLLGESKQFPLWGRKALWYGRNKIHPRILARTWFLNLFRKRSQELYGMRSTISTFWTCCICLTFPVSGFF